MAYGLHHHEASVITSYSIHYTKLYECRVVEHIAEHNIFVLDGVGAWLDTRREERRTLHAIGDGRFIVDGEIINLREQMAAKLPPGV